MIIEIGDNLGFVIMVVGVFWALAYAFKGYHDSCRQDKD